MPIKTAIKCKHNRPDIVIWDTVNKQCFVIEISCPADVNVTSKVENKEQIYAELIRNLQLIYREYKFTFLPIIVGALGYIPKCLDDNL